ncbi:histone-lysine N-methyltransferase SETD1A-like [Ischnura elegans]|uniref:histone-lysine N-methyltransferase SETD1A-like n=1 Tax=Ischnura elegans TaxID=197161 RepID=UPI001ED86B8E|nr:histone-lysine N-methyltransferase SETD1A-like [Ischnura elegans]
MKLSFVIELLLIFLLIAFAASRVIESRDAKALKSQQKQENAPNRYCSCSTDSCDCCRDFALPVIPIKGPGCASLRYVDGDKMDLSLKFGDRVLATHTITGKRPKPVCMRLPGGFSKFCGRVYGISKEPDSFHACLGLEIRALDDLEAALRVSCFRFSPEGLRLEPAKPLPAEEEDDDDEDDYGFGDDSDEEEDEEEEEEDEALGGASEDEEEDDDIAAGVGDDNEISADYAGFSILGDLLGLDDESAEVPVKKKPNKKTTTPAPFQEPTHVPHKVIVQVHHIHDSSGSKPEAVVEVPEPAVTNNKVMDKVETTSAAPTPTKQTNAKPSAKPTTKPTKAPTKAPTRGTTKAPPKQAAKPTTSAPIMEDVSEETSMVTVMEFKPSTSSDYTVNVVQDGQPLQTMDDTRTPDAATEPEIMVDMTTTMPEGTMSEDGEKVAEVPVASPDVMVAADEPETEDEKQEVDIGVVKDEEATTAAETSMPATVPTTSAAPPVPSAVVQTEAPTPAPQAAVPSATATAEKDEDDADADDVVEEVEDAVATVFSAGVDEDEDEDDDDDDEEEEEEEEPEKEEDEKEEEEEEEEASEEEGSEEEEEESEEEETEKPQGDKNDSTYDDEEEEEDDEKEEAVTEIPTTTQSSEKRWRRRKNRLDHIFWQ